MKRLSVVVLERDRRAALRALGRTGAVHLIRSRPGPDTAPNPPPDPSAALRRCDALLEKVQRLAHALGIRLEEPPAEALPDLGLEEVERRLARLAERLEGPLATRDDLRRRWAETVAVLAQVEGFETLDLPVEGLGGLSFLHFALGSLPEENLAALESAVGENVVLVPLGEAEGRRRLVAVTSRKGRFALETALEEAGFEHHRPAAEGGGTLAEVAARLRRRRGDLAQALAEADGRLRRLAEEAAPLLAEAAALVRLERRLLEAEQHFPRTEATVLITGWVPAEDVGRVVRRLRTALGARCVVETTGADEVPEAEVPVLLRHPWLLRPFQMLVTAYGLPGYRDLEPTLFVALTFLGMFGMMFGDMGHGAVLVAGGVLAALYGRSERVRDGGVLVASAGLASALFGLLYGECFGIDLEGLALWHNPLDPAAATTFIGTAIAIGIGVISLGLVLNIVNRVRRGEWLEAVLHHAGLVGGVFYWGSIALVLRWGVKRRSDLDWLLAAVVGAALAALLVREPLLRALYRRRDEAPAGEAGREAGEGGGTVGGLVEACLESVIHVFETVLTYLSNTISFVRLAAYAMSHTALLVATFLLADEVATAAGAVGGPLRVVIIVVGNVLTIALEGIIASVQALRLEYYEFFSKFYAARGRAFTPFRLGGESPSSQTHT